MIVVRAPLRISFVGGGTDLAAFFRRYPGRVVSATIDKYVYVVINATPLIEKITAKYQKTELVSHPAELEHRGIRAALLDFGIVEPGIEIGSFADLQSNTGLGSSSSFAVALVKGLSAYQEKKLSKQEAAEAACRLEIELMGEPIGKQDQYAAAFGGFNHFQFNADNSVDVDPVLLDYKNRSHLEDHVLLFFTGITRSASSVLAHQAVTVDQHAETYIKMSDSAALFADRLKTGDIAGMAELLCDAWAFKKQIAQTASTPVIDQLYDVGISSGALAGKVMGAGGGGCLLFLAPPKAHERILYALNECARDAQLAGFKKIPVRFVQSGTDIIFNSHRTLS